MPNTLRPGIHCANPGSPGKHAEAASEYQQVIDLENKVLGPENPDTLRSRSSFAYALDHQGKYSEAELNLRDVIRLEEKVLGPESRYPDQPAKARQVLMSQVSSPSRSGFSRLLPSRERSWARSIQTALGGSGLANHIQAAGKHPMPPPSIAK